MTCSDLTILVGETRTIEGVTIKLKQILFDYAYVDIISPWNASYSRTIGLGNTITIKRTDTEYVNITFFTYSGNLAKFNICYEKDIELGSIFCESNPSGAKVYYKNTYIEQYTYMGTTPMWIEDVPPGVRYIEMKLSGYHDHEDSYTVESGKITGVDIDLDPIATTGTLSCNTVPDGAKIYLNNVYQGLTNKTIPDLTPGTYTVKYTKDGYEDYTKTMTINAGQISYLTKYLLTEPEPTGTINCTSNPLGAEIWINGSNTGEVTPKAFVNMPVKRHEVKFKMVDYYDYSDIFDVKENEITNVFATLVSSIEEPTCIDYTTQQECEDNGCYWHSDNTCQSAPEGTTEYFDVHIKPYSFYDGKYEEAVSKALTIVTDLTGAMANYVSSITGYEYKGIDILEDANKQVIVVRVYLKDTNETALIAPAIIAGAVIVIAAIMLAIGYIIGTSEGDFSKADITQLAKDIITNAEIDAYEHAYDIDKSTAIKLIDCLRTIETCDDSLTCFENNNVTPSLSNQMEVLVAYETSIDSVYTGVADIVEDAEFEAFAAKTLAELEIVIEKLESATITPEGAACITTDIIDDTKEDLDEKIEEQEDEECAWELFDECIITKKAAKNIVLVAAGLGGLMVLSIAKGITKK